MHILLVADAFQSRCHHSTVFESLPYSTSVAASAEAAIEACRATPPDVIVVFPSPSGDDAFSSVSSIRMATESHQSRIVALCPERNDAEEAAAYAAGADVCLGLAPSPDVLKACLRGIEISLATQRRLQAVSTKLELMGVVAEEERAVSRLLLEQAVNHDALDDPALSLWQRTANGTGGDLVLACRTPADALHLLLADSSVEGVAASVRMLPLVAPFYRMTEKGFGIDSIARELRAKSSSSGSAGRRLAITLVSLDAREGLVTVWNDGNPAPVLIGKSGCRILQSSESGPTVTQWPIGDDDVLLLVSDGVDAAKTVDGSSPSNLELADALAHSNIRGRIDFPVAMANYFCADVVPDDISVLLADCCYLGSVAVGATGQSGTKVAGSTAWHLVLNLGPDEVRAVDVVPVLIGIVEQFRIAGASAGHLFLVLAELYNNALDHGLLGLDSRLKLTGEGMSAYLGERTRRLAQLESGRIEIALRLEDDASSRRLYVRCKDSGAGFDVDAVLAESADVSERPFGRGLVLLRSICHSLCYSDHGATVEAGLVLQAR